MYVICCKLAILEIFLMDILILSLSESLHSNIFVKCITLKV